MTGQNRSSAVMQQRVDPPDSLDFFPTPPWGTRALCEHVLPHFGGVTMSVRSAWDPACGRGDMVRPLCEYFAQVWGTDIHDYGIGAPVHDFRRGVSFAGGVDFGEAGRFGPVDMIITNPPFNLAAVFALKGLEIAGLGLALLVRLAFLETGGRYRGLFRDRPPALIAQFVERLPMFKGRLDPGGDTASAYAWIVWTAQSAGASAKAGETRFIWIPPCRAVLERHGDYDGYDVTPGSAPGRPSGDLFAGAPQAPERSSK